MNPFLVDKIVTPEDFCGRKEELSELLSLIESKANVMLYGDRRYGKTSLIKKAFSLIPKNVLPIYVDIYDAVDEMDFSRKLYIAVEEATPMTLRKEAGKLLDMLGRIKGVDFKPSQTGDGFSFKPSIVSKDFDQLLESAIHLIEQYCKHSGSSHAVIAFDEFQQVADMKGVKIDAKLRQISQENSNVSFIFSGSKKSILRELINAPKQPWHGMTTPISVKGIDVESLKNYCEKRLGGKFEMTAFESVYKAFRGQTRLILQTCFYLYARDIKNPLIVDIQKAIKDQVASYDDEFRDKFAMYSMRQKKAFKAVSKAEPGTLFSKETLEEQNIIKQALNQAITSLEKLDEMQKISEGVYQINNIMFDLWLKKMD